VLLATTVRARDSWRETSARLGESVSLLSLREREDIKHPASLSGTETAGVRKALLRAPGLPSSIDEGAVL
jgi:hypothetical protein